MNRPCLGWDGHPCPNLTPNTRCPTCEAKRQRHRNQSPNRDHYRGPWARIARTLIAAHLAELGPNCPGYATPPHPCHPTDLTVDHIQPRTTLAGLRVLCRSCNSRKKNRTDDA